MGYPVSADSSEELVALIRGAFAASVVAALSRLGVFEIMLFKPAFGCEDFCSIQNKKLLRDSFQYLSRLGLLRSVPESTAYQLTELGKQIILRAGSFYVPHSYHDYMDHFYERLAGQWTKPPVVDRAENVMGSGKTHRRYFPYAVSFLKRRAAFDMVVDVGCGDGHFLGAVLESFPKKSVVGVDLSPVAIRMTKENLSGEYPGRQIEMISSDAVHVDAWAGEVRKIAKGRMIALSMWFLLHEISGNDPERISDFLSKVHGFFPEAPLVVCEIVRHDSETLSRHSRRSLMPEYLFFHDLSGQGVLSWNDYCGVLKKIPYGLASERLFDELSDSAGNRIPSSFLWCLVPKKDL